MPYAVIFPIEQEKASHITTLWNALAETTCAHGPISRDQIVFNYEPHVTGIVFNNAAIIRDLGKKLEAFADEWSPFSLRFRGLIEHDTRNMRFVIKNYLIARNWPM